MSVQFSRNIKITSDDYRYMVSQLYEFLIRVIFTRKRNGDMN